MEVGPAAIDAALNAQASVKPADLAMPNADATRDAAAVTAVPAAPGIEEAGIGPVPQSHDGGLTPAAAVAPPPPEPAQVGKAALAPAEAQAPTGVVAVKFDLAAVPEAARPGRSRFAAASRSAAVGTAVKPAASSRRVPSSRISAAGRTPVKAPLGNRYRTTPRGLEFDMIASVNGTVSGKLPLLVDSTDHLSVRLVDVLALVRPLMDQQVFDRLAASGSAQEYVSFAMLRSSGIDVRYDAGRNELALGFPGND